VSDPIDSELDERVAFVLEPFLCNTTGFALDARPVFDSGFVVRIVTDSALDVSDDIDFVLETLPAIGFELVV
jgi:hypothetical protein